MMNKKFEDLIDKEKYQVFIFSCSAYFPFIFARHPWFVLNEKGVISRYEIGHYKNHGKSDFLQINEFSPFMGIHITFFTNVSHKNVRLLGMIEGEQGSIAEKAVQFIKNSFNTYSYCNEYRVLGPNSNTYLQNFLNSFPEFGIKLPWNYIGKDFK